MIIDYLPALPIMNHAGSVTVADGVVTMSVFGTESTMHEVNEIIEAWQNATLHGFCRWEQLADKLVKSDSGKITLIKEFRDHTGCGLKDAKDAIEAAMARKSPHFEFVKRTMMDEWGPVAGIERVVSKVADYIDNLNEFGR
jgi:ribosomal protein L7/L12